MSLNLPCYPGYSVMWKQDDQAVSMQVSAHLLELAMKQAMLSPNLGINFYLLHR